MTNKKFTPFEESAMNIALRQAEIAFGKNEVPVGAALFVGEKCIAKAHNRVFETNDPTMHAEIICLKKAAKILNDYRLTEAVLFITLEPCGMCGGAIHNFRLKKVIWGAKDLRVGAAGTLYNLFDGRHPIHKVESIGGLKEEESAKLLKKFFQKRRKEKACQKHLKK